MRQVGDILGRARADRFVNFLTKEGIEAVLREDGNERYSIWVMDEDKLSEAGQAYRAYKASPDATCFDAPSVKPKKFQDSTAKPRSRSRHIDVRTQLFGQGWASGIPVTIIMIALSVILTLASNVPGAMQFMRYFYFSEYMGRHFPEIASGQIWRLVTPIFMHGGLLHILFNMIWLYQLGGAIERIEGSGYMLFLTLLMGALVDTTQYLVAGPLFLGMSGVVYAMLGYIWVMSHYEPASRYFMSRETMLIMVIWLVICLVGIIPGVANAEHVSGLIYGLAFGYLRSRYVSTVRRRRRSRR